MADYVVDTNVWVWVDKPLDDCQTVEELDCLDTCREWLQSFVHGDDKLAVDLSYEILREYRRDIEHYAPNGLARQLLNILETKPRERKLIEVEIRFDDDGYAILPDTVIFNDPNDRKFIAVSIQFEPPLPIVNASDTDWRKDRQSLEANNIQVIELCPGYIELRIK